MGVDGLKRQRIAADADLPGPPVRDQMHRIDRTAGGRLLDQRGHFVDAAIAVDPHQQPVGGVVLSQEAADLVNEDRRLGQGAVDDDQFPPPLGLVGVLLRRRLTEFGDHGGRVNGSAVVRTGQFSRIDWHSRE